MEDIDTAYAYQSIIRGGHTFLTARTGPDKVTNMGDRIDLFIPLNQDTMDRHLGLLTAGSSCIYNADTIKPGVAADGVQMCPLPVSELADITRNLSVDSTELDFGPVIDRGELITSANGNGADSESSVHGNYLRYMITDSGVSPCAVPGVPGHIHTAATDEHQEDGVLISDEFTNPIKRRAMVEKRMRKVTGIESAVPPPTLSGPPHADVTLIGWGSTRGVIEEACELLSAQGIAANQLQIRWLVPLHGEAILRILKDARHTIIVENNCSGQFARYLRSETSFVPDGHIRKYDGEPFMPHHIVEAVKEQLSGNTNLSVPTHAKESNAIQRNRPAPESSGDSSAGPETFGAAQPLTSMYAGGLPQASLLQVRGR